MFKISTSLLTSLLLSFSTLLLVTACEDESGTSATGTMKTYALASVSNPAISGTVTFAENSDASATISIQLNGTTAGSMYPAHIHLNTAAEGGGIAISLGDVNGSTGKSEKTVSKLDDGTSITYTQLLQFDGYVNVHNGASDLGTLIAQGDIGQNELTGTMKEYTLASVSNPAISGKVTFYKRVNNETLSVIQLTGTSAGGIHPAHVHNGNVAAPGSIAIPLGNVTGATGTSKVNISMANSAAITYDQLVVFNGYVNVHLSGTELGTLVAQGNIGSNHSH